ncbi:alpha/beta hydrolase [Aminobacter sp. SR38]|uniref:alpha/beta hydrolase n=2 Tax=Aminobacter TaxID=31988 RepID=UPI0017805DDC|nr:alpha/beta hydrolase [Aminobacter sp. SR38]QOF71792.1 alpha/beta hydrolase [Aminobacter sp. SR38]
MPTAPSKQQNGFNLRKASPVPGGAFFGSPDRTMRRVLGLAFIPAEEMPRRLVMELALDADIAAMAEVVAKRPPLDLANVDIPALRAAVNAAGWPTERTEMAAVENITVAGGAGDIPARLYKPRQGKALPLLVFLHGGGFVLCSLDTHDNFCRALAKAGDCAVLSIDYRLAPEHRFPAAYEDALAALEWAAANAITLGCDGRRLALAGDSAGGNLAAAAALHASSEVRLKLRHLLLFYPASDPTASGTSYDTFPQTPFLSAGMMRWYWRQYVGEPAGLADPRVALLRSVDLAGLPQTTIAIAEFDPLRTEVEALYTALAESGVDVEARRYDGVSHGFASMVGLIGKARLAIDHGGARLRDAFARNA